jgi:hypothetical protein
MGPTIRRILALNAHVVQPSGELNHAVFLVTQRGRCFDAQVTRIVPLEQHRVAFHAVAVTRDLTECERQMLERVSVARDGLGWDEDDIALSEMIFHGVPFNV